MKNYIVRILSISAVILALAFPLFYFVLPQFYLQIFPVMILVFVLTGIFIYALLAKASKKNMRQFSTYFMGSIGLKLLIYMIFVAVYVSLNRQNSHNFVIQFFILYLVYTIFETGAIIKTVNGENTK